MDRFIKECRREWKRLRVPDAIANEMAADLMADLKEAESEGASAEEVLGSGVFDPRSFAASWAAERGVINPPPVKQRLPGRSPMLVAIVVCTVIAAIGGGLVIGSHLGSGPVAVLAGPPNRAFTFCQPRLEPFMPPARVCSRNELALPGPAQLFVRAPGRAASPVGWALFIVGIVGIVLLTLMWWAVPGPWSRRHTQIDETQGGSG